MKKLILLCGAAAMVLSSCGTTGGTPKSEKDSLAYIIGYNWGTALRDLDPTIDISEQGEDPKPDSASTVKVMFKLSDRNGKVIQEINEERGPVDMNLQQVLPAWAEGLQLIGKGGKIKLWLPAELGYGKHGNQMVEPNSALVFEVDLVDIVPEEAEEAAE